MIKVYGLTAYVPALKGLVRDVRVTSLLEELGEKYERIVMDPVKGENRSPEYLKLNPTGKVPTITDGAVTLFESAAICEYLASSHGRFQPTSNTPAFWEHKQWCYYVLTNIEPHTGRVFSCDHIIEKSEGSAYARKLAADVLARMLAPLDSRLATQKFLMGEDLMLADLYLASCMTYVRDSNVLDSFPNLQRHLGALMDRPAFQKAFSANGARP